MKKTALLTLCLLVTIAVQAKIEKINGSKLNEGTTLAGVITDAKTGRGIKGVPVTDGYSFTVTDNHGVYQMTADPRARTVSYTTPANYKTAQDSTGGPAFFARLDREAPFNRIDFTLEKLPDIENNFTIIALADPQCQSDYDVERFRSETIPDLQATVSDAVAAGEKVYAVGLGDIVFDNLALWEPMHDSFRSISADGISVPIYNVPGNHDHSNKTDNDYDATGNFIHWIGPTDYSLDRGKVHLVFMDDVVFLHNNPENSKRFTNCTYASGFSDEQLEWLRQDLSLVEDKEEKMVLLCTHIPFRQGGKDDSGSSVNYNKHYSDVLTLLTQFRNAQIFIGHTHYPQYYSHKDYVCRGGQPVAEQVHGAVCGAWWHANICVDGTPNGYAVYKVNGSEIVDMYGKFTGLDKGVQMRVYDGNQVYTGNKGLSYEWESDLKKCFIATVWYAEPENWTVEFIQNGKVYPMTHVDRYQRDWLAYSTLINQAGRSVTNKSYMAERTHFWYIESYSGEPSAEKYWQIRATHTIPSSGETHVYTCDSLTTDYDGLWDSWMK